MPIFSLFIKTTQDGSWLTQRICRHCIMSIINSSASTIFRVLWSDAMSSLQCSRGLSTGLIPVESCFRTNFITLQSSSLFCFPYLFILKLYILKMREEITYPSLCQLYIETEDDSLPSIRTVLVFHANPH